MARFRNGNRLVEAAQQPSGDWLVWNGRREQLVEDRQFRARWEPADEDARRLWRGVGVDLESQKNPMAVELEGRRRRISGRAIGQT